MIKRNYLLAAAEIIAIGLIIVTCANGQTTPSRTWTDDSATYSLEASLFNTTDRLARLINANCKTIEVPLNRLSETDRAYIAETDGTDQLTTSPAVENAEQIDAYPLSSIDRSNLLSPSPTDADSWKLDLPSQKRWTTEGARLIGYRIDDVPFFGDMILNQRKNLGLLPFSSGKTAGKQKAIWAFDLENQRSLGTVLLPPRDCEPRDVSPNGRLLITQPGKSVFDPRIDVWRNDRGKMVHICAFKPYGDERSRVKGNVKNVYFVTNRSVLTMGGDDVATLWSIPDAKAICEFEIGDSRQPALSSDRRFVIGSTFTELLAFDLFKLKYVGRLDLKESLSNSDVRPSRPKWVPQQNFIEISPSGKFTAGAWFDILRVWENESGRLVSEVPFQGTAQSIQWIDDRFILTSDLYLIDTKLQVPIWKYQNRVNLDGEFIDGNGVVWGAEYDDGVVRLIPFRLPDTAARKVIENWDAKKIVRLQSGTEVDLQLNVPFSNRSTNELNQDMRRRFEQFGLILKQDADTRIIVDWSLGPTKDRQVERADGSGKRTIGVQESTISARIEQLGRTIWKDDEERGETYLVAKSPDDQAVASANNQRSMRADVKSIRTINFPSLIIDVPQEGSFGYSELTAEGIREIKFYLPADQK